MMSTELGERKKEARLQAVLSPTLLDDIDQYYHAARLDSKSDAIRRLLRFALETNLPQEHLEIITIMRKSGANNVPKNLHEKSERIHIALEPDERSEICDYRNAAHHSSRTETIRFLIQLALKGKLPKAHLDIVNQFIAPRRRIRLRAHLIWEREGRPEWKSDEHWHRAAAELADEAANALVNAGADQPERPALAGGIAGANSQSREPC